ncbi:hypothetical protein VQ03_13715 [Methylobacterium tarhaniae]|uniref:Uncharacterized protein n=1 Tax=Methylobacterium tarhaniae TaxID=1187852 RepID=A0A0J6VNS8_9HYPH|nr:hypothetical protein VQ03_13715 [Methylobacterium tarhaniae]
MPLQSGRQARQGQGVLFRRFRLTQVVVKPGATGSKRKRDRVTILNATILRAEAYALDEPQDGRKVQDKNLKE